VHIALEKSFQLPRDGVDPQFQRAMLEPMNGRSDARGQATSEYVALIALVGVMLALAAGLTSGGVAGHVLAGLQRGLCRIAGTTCPRSQPPDADLAPCPVERTTSTESLGGALALVKVGGSGMLTAVRGSDGRVTMTLADGTTAGGEVGLGFALGLGDRHGGVATAGVEASVTSGRSWTLPDAAAARAFAARYGSKETIGGKAVDLVRSGCSILCDAVGWHPHAELPPPDELYMSYGGAAKLAVPFGLVVPHGSVGGLIGARLRRDGSNTWFLQLDGSAGVDLQLEPDAVTLSRQQQTVISYTLDADHRPTQLVVHTVGRDDGRGMLRGARSRVTGSIGAGGARVIELDATLDLHDQENGAAAAALVAALRDPLAVGELRRSATALRERVARAGSIDRRIYALSSSAFELGAKLALGTELGGSFAHTHEGMRLLSADTRLPGLPFLPRDDCRPA
jgi:hypothetical protein